MREVLSPLIFMPRFIFDRLTFFLPQYFYDLILDFSVALIINISFAKLSFSVSLWAGVALFLICSLFFLYVGLFNDVEFFKSDPEKVETKLTKVEVPSEDNEKYNELLAKRVKRMEAELERYEKETVYNKKRSRSTRRQVKLKRMEAVAFLKNAPVPIIASESELLDIGTLTLEAQSELDTNNTEHLYEAKQQFELPASGPGVSMGVRSRLRSEVFPDEYEENLPETAVVDAEDDPGRIFADLMEQRDVLECYESLLKDATNAGLNKKHEHGPGYSSVDRILDSGVRVRRRYRQRQKLAIIYSQHDEVASTEKQPPAEKEGMN